MTSAQDPPPGKDPDAPPADAPGASPDDAPDASPGDAPGASPGYAPGASPGDEPDPRDDAWTLPSPRPRPPYRMRVTDQVLSVVGLACAAVSVLFSPVLFGLAGIVLGIVGHTKGEPLGKWAAVAAGVGMIIGTILSAVLESLVS